MLMKKTRKRRLDLIGVNTLKDIDFKPILLIPTIVIIFIAFILIFTQQTPLVIYGVGYVLSFYREWAMIFWVIVGICGICSYISSKNPICDEREFIFHILSVATYGLSFQTAITMLNGIFKQYFAEYEFIRDIGKSELIIIGFVMGGLLFWSITRVYRDAVVTYTYSEAKSKIIGSS